MVAHEPLSEKAQFKPRCSIGALTKIFFLHVRTGIAAGVDKLRPFEQPCGRRALFIISLCVDNNSCATVKKSTVQTPLFDRCYDNLLFFLVRTVSAAGVDKLRLFCATLLTTCTFQYIALRRW